MNVDTARKVDRYLGVPLCFLGTIVRKVLSFLIPASAGAPLRNVLFIEFSEMGSTILADPAMQKLKRSRDVNLHFAIFRTNAPSLELLGTVPRDRVFRMADTGLAAVAVDALRFLVWTRRKRIDTVVDLEMFSRFTALLSGFSGAVRTVGFHAFENEGLYRGGFLTHRVAYNPHQHMAKNFIALVNALLSPSAEVPYSKSVIGDEETAVRKAAVPEAEKEKMRRRIGETWPAFDERRHRVVLFNTNASDLVPLRRWPREHFVELARTVLERYPRTVIVLPGATSEASEKADIIAAVGSERCVSFAGRTAVAELPALYAVSSLMLTNDSGPAHFAAVTDLPVFVLFGPETPKLYGPLGRATPISAGLACSPCVSAANHRKTVCRDNVCMQVITPAQVFETLKPLLDVLR